MKKEKVLIPEIESEEKDLGSANTFEIEDIEVKQSSGDVVVRYEAIVKARLIFRCRAHGFLLGMFKMETEGYDLSHEEALRKCIQKLLSHEYYPRRDINAPKCDCSPTFGNVNYYFMNLKEPFKSLFEDLFKDENWSYPKELTIWK